MPAPKGLLAGLGFLGTGLISAISTAVSNKQQREQLQARIDLINRTAINPEEYIKRLNETFAQLSEQTVNEIGKAYSQQNQELSKSLSQRRLIGSGFEAGARGKLGKSKSEDIAKSLLGIKQAQIGSELSVRQAAFNQMMQAMPGMQQQAQGSPFGEFLGTAFGPIAEASQKKVGESITKAFG